MVFSLHTGGGAHSAHRLLRWEATLTAQGWTGVTLFFILSGFLVTGILWDSRGQEGWWSHFYRRRILRIFPLYYASLVAVLVAALFDGSFRLAFSRIWSPLLFLQDVPGRPLFNINHTGSPLYLFHFWSLAVEEQFYLLWPFLVLLPRSRRGMMLVCGAVILGSEIFGYLQGVHGVGRSLPMLLPRSAELATGGWLAMAYRSPLWGKLRGWAGLTFALGLAGFVLAIHRAITPLALPAITLCFASLVILALQQPAVSWFFRMRWLRWIGSISYGLYVFHVMLAQVFDGLAHRIAGPGATVTFFVWNALLNGTGSVAIAWISWKFFESPILRLQPKAKPPRNKDHHVSLVGTV